MDDTQKLIIKKIDEFATKNSEEHEKIQKQVTRTNGRVTSLEMWRAYLLGAWAVLMILVMPLIIHLIKQYL